MDSGSKLAEFMAEIDKMAQEGLLSAEAVDKIKGNVEEAKEAGFFSSAGNLLSHGQFGRMARGKLGDEGQIDALYSALKGKRGMLGSRESAMDAINVAAAKKGDAGTFASHIDTITGGGGKGGGSNMAQTALLFGLPAAAIVADAGYNATRSGTNFSSMLEENPELYDMPEDAVRKAYRVVSTYAPSMTDDPFVAGSAVKKLVEYEAVDPATVRTYQDAESNSTAVVPRLLKAFQQVSGVAAKGLGGGEA